MTISPQCRPRAASYRSFPPYAMLLVVLLCCLVSCAFSQAPDQDTEKFTPACGNDFNWIPSRGFCDCHEQIVPKGDYADDYCEMERHGTFMQAKIFQYSYTQPNEGQYVIGITISSPPELPITGATLRIVPVTVSDDEGHEDEEEDGDNNDGDNGDGDGDQDDNKDDHLTTTSDDPISFDSNLIISRCVVTDRIGQGRENLDYVETVGKRGDLTEDAPYLYTLDIPQRDAAKEHITLECYIFRRTITALPTTQALRVELTPPSDAFPPYVYPTPSVRTDTFSIHTNAREFSGYLDNLEVNGKPQTLPTIPQLVSKGEIDFTMRMTSKSGAYFLPGDYLLIGGSISRYILSASCTLKMSFQSMRQRPLVTQWGRDVKCTYHPITSPYGGPSPDYPLACELAPFYHSLDNYHPQSTVTDDLLSTMDIFENGRRPPPLSCKIKLRTIIDDLSIENPTLVVQAFSRHQSMDAFIHGQNDDGDGEQGGDGLEGLENTKEEEQQKEEEDRATSLLNFVIAPTTIQFALPERTMQWRCYTSDSDGEEGSSTPVTLDVDCTAAAPQCPPTESSRCGESCAFVSECILDGEVTADFACINGGLPKPHILGEVLYPCLVCTTPGKEAHTGPACDVAPRFTPLYIERVNKLYVAELDVDEHHDNDGHTYSDAKDCDIELTYGTVFTLAWSYVGAENAVMSIFLDPYVPYLRDGWQPLIATVRASDMRYTFRLEDVPSIRQFKRQIDGKSKSPLFYGVIGGTYTAERPQAVFRKFNLLPAIHPRCKSVVPPEELSSPPFPDAMSSTAREQPIATGCHNSGYCDRPTGECMCLYPYTGEFCLQTHRAKDSQVCSELHACVGANTRPPLLGGECVSTVDPFTASSPPSPTKVEKEHLQCSCLDGYYGEQCQHQSICEAIACEHGRRVSLTGNPADCYCQCNTKNVSGETCASETCLLRCEQGALNDECTGCDCPPGYTGNYCETPLFRHIVHLPRFPSELARSFEAIEQIPMSSDAILAQDFQNELLKALIIDYNSIIMLGQKFRIDEIDEGIIVSPSIDKIVFKADQYDPIYSIHSSLRMHLLPEDMKVRLYAFGVRIVGPDFSSTSQFRFLEGVLNDYGFFAGQQEGSRYKMTFFDDACLLSECKGTNMAKGLSAGWMPFLLMIVSAAMLVIVSNGMIV